MTRKLNRIRSWVGDRTWRWGLHRRLGKIDVPGAASDLPSGASAESEAPTEIAIRTAVGGALEQRRQRVEAAVKPLWDDLAASLIPAQERDFGCVLQDLEGKIEDIHADSRGDLVAAERERADAQGELDRFVDAAQCRRNENYSRDTSRLRWGATAIVLVEAAVGAGVFGDYSRGGMAESFVIGGVIGGAIVICGFMCAWGWQAGWRRPAVKGTATAAPVALAGSITLAAAHYREALAAGARNALERAVETLLTNTFEPLASLPLLILAAFGAFAFVHIVRTWLSIFGRVPGYRKRVLRVFNAQQRMSTVDSLGKAKVSGATESAKGAVATILAHGQQRRDTAGNRERSILAWVSQYHGEKAEIRKIGDEKLALFAAIAARYCGHAWAARTIREGFGMPLAIEDPRPLTAQIDTAVAGQEKSRSSVVLMIERIGAAGKDYITAMTTAIARGVDIGPDFARRASGPAPALARGRG